MISKEELTDAMYQALSDLGIGYIQPPDPENISKIMAEILTAEDETTYYASVDWWEGFSHVPIPPPIPTEAECPNCQGLRWYILLEDGEHD